MKYFQTKGHVGPDGKVFIIAPADFANEDVLVTVRKEKPSSDHDDWKEFIRSTAGSIPDFPELDRPRPDSYEGRESLD